VFEVLKARLQVSIIDESGRRDCAAACGTEWSSPDALSLAQQQVKSRFDDDAHLEYLDLVQGLPGQQAEEWRKAIRERDLSVPLLVINGRVRLAGRFDVRQIIDAIEAEMEIGI